MKKDPEKIKGLVSSHIEYWSSFKMKSYQGGPFGDREGGLIIFESTNLAEATELTMNDPFVKQNAIGQKWVKEWIFEQ